MTTTGRPARPHPRPDGLWSRPTAACACAPARTDDRLSSTAGRTLLNPGSVGQPRDGDPRASYLVLDTDDRVVTWHRVAYDIEAVDAAMVAAGLPRRLARTACVMAL